MANTKSAAKMMRVSARKRQRNRPVKSATRTAVSKAQQAIVGGDPNEAAAAVQAAVRALDKAAAKGVIHPNNAARRKSRLMRRAHSAPAAD